MKNIDLSKYQNNFGLAHKLKRVIFQVSWSLLVRPLPRSLGNSWKILILRAFGANIHKTAKIYSSVKIYAPWNLYMAAYSCLAPEVDCYNVEKVYIGEHATVSQKAYLCTASHNINKSTNPLITGPIKIGNQSWVGASAYISLGVNIGEGSVVGATASVYKDVQPWNVVGGNPAKFLKIRVIDK